MCAPDPTVKQLTGAPATRQDDLNVNKMFRMAESAVPIDGVIHDYLASPSMQVTISAPKLPLLEFGGVFPVEGYNLHPSLDAGRDGPQDACDGAQREIRGGYRHGTLPRI